MSAGARRAEGGAARAWVGPAARGPRVKGALVSQRDGTSVPRKRHGAVLELAPPGQCAGMMRSGGHPRVSFILSKGEAWFYVSGGKEEDMQCYFRVSWTAEQHI